VSQRARQSSTSTKSPSGFAQPFISGLSEASLNRISSAQPPPAASQSP
jgi:hypothetical protein